MSKQDCFPFILGGKVHLSVMGKSLCGIKVDQNQITNLEVNCPKCKVEMEKILRELPEKLQNITLIKTKDYSTYGYVVRLYFKKKAVINKYFSFYFYKEQTLKIAKIYLFHALKWYKKKYRREKRLYPYFYTKPFPHNKTTGVTGVHFTAPKDSRTGKKIPQFVVTWRENKKPKSKRFYLSHYSNPEKALAEAILYRKQKEKELLIEKSKNL